jgi:hypothetical protein
MRLPINWRSPERSSSPHQTAQKSRTEGVTPAFGGFAEPDRLCVDRISLRSRLSNAKKPAVSNSAAQFCRNMNKNVALFEAIEE